VDDAVNSVAPLALKDALRLVYVVGPGAIEDWRRLDAALGAGVTATWLRLPHASGAEVYRRAKDLLDRCRPFGVAVIVGDRADVALAVGAHGVQLGHRSPPARKVRPWFSRWLGVSCHSGSELRRAQEAGADYAVLSPLFGVPEKGAPLGVAAFQRLRVAVGIPVVALGGVDPQNAPQAREAGADGVAVIRAIRDAENAEAAVRMLRGAVA
jgi:thiamine-phosphate pyrophosphorylase